MATYALVLGVKAAKETIYPIQDNFLWLGRTILEVPGWVFVYTGPGATTAVSLEDHTKEPIHSMYWNKAGVILQDSQVLPALIQIADVSYTDVNKNVLALVNRPVFDSKAIADLFKTIGLGEPHRPK